MASRWPLATRAPAHAHAPPPPRCIARVQVGALVAKLVADHARLRGAVGEGGGKAAALQDKVAELTEKVRRATSLVARHTPLGHHLFRYFSTLSFFFSCGGSRSFHARPALKYLTLSVLLTSLSTCSPP